MLIFSRNKIKIHTGYKIRNVKNRVNFILPSSYCMFVILQIQRNFGTLVWCSYLLPASFQLMSEQNTSLMGCKSQITFFWCQGVTFLLYTNSGPDWSKITRKQDYVHRVVKRCMKNHIQLSLHLNS